MAAAGPLGLCEAARASLLAILSDHIARLIALLETLLADWRNATLVPSPAPQRRFATAPSPTRIARARPRARRRRTPSEAPPSRPSPLPSRTPPAPAPRARRPRAALPLPKPKHRQTGCITRHSLWGGPNTMACSPHGQTPRLLRPDQPARP